MFTLTNINTDQYGTISCMYLLIAMQLISNGAHLALSTRGYYYYSTSEVSAYLTPSPCKIKKNKKKNIF